MTELSQKYDFLLRPIKDLTKNWNVDIAAVLEDFHEELEKMTFSFDGGKTQLNFAEAAFLIQGTACVWSRKVESLHNLVYQTLEMIMSNRHNKQPTSIDQQGVDADATFDSHEDKLLNLDDIRNTNMKKISGSGVALNCISLRSPFLQRSEENRGSPFLKQVAASLLATVPSLSPGLGNLVDTDIICSKIGEVTNYYHDFWSNNVTPQTRGCVLLECRIDDVMNKVITQPQACEEKSANAEVLNDVPLDNPADDFVEDMDACDDHSEAPNGITLADVPEITHKSEEFRRNLRPRNPQVAPSLVSVEPLPPKNVPLDPHCKCPEWDPKPFKKGNTLKYPASLQENPKKRKASQPVSSIPLISDFLDIAKKSSSKEIDSLKREKLRRNELWKKLGPNKPETRLSSMEQERVENASPEIDDVPVNFDEQDSSDVDDLINDVTLGTAGLAPADLPQPEDFLDYDLDSYEGLVRHHVELFYSSAKRYVQESALSQRVRGWQETIDPFLSEQDDRPEFDIHKCGDDVINSIPSVGMQRSFGDCVRGQEAWQICRHFAATLQLANDNNVELATKCKDLQNSVNSLQVKLISRHRAKDMIADYVPI